MKKLILLCSVVMAFSTCSTDLDILDNWKETMVVYGLLDQSQPKQYIRIEKAFLGPDNALSMAQNYDSINYLNNLDVWLQEKDANGNVVNFFQLNPDTLTNKNSGIFYFPEQVVYSMNTPAVNTAHTYKLIVNNSATGTSVDATTTLVNDFTISRPQGPTISLVKINSNTTVQVQWAGSANARLYQVVARFYYSQKHIDNSVDNLVTPDWLIKTTTATANTATSTQSIDFDPNAFFKNLATVIPYDPTVVSRTDQFIEFTVYAGGEELQTYMDVNGPSSSIVQEKPIYTNINNGLGLFSSRYAKTKSNLTLTPQTIDTLAMGQFSCGLKFTARDHITVPGCQ